jgi:hypothetical protein
LREWAPDRPDDTFGHPGEDPKFGDRPPGERTRRLLFYARPSSGKRNLFELGVAALQKLGLNPILRMVGRGMASGGGSLADGKIAILRL